MSCCSDSESDSHLSVFAASPALGACELCKAPIPKGQKADQGLYAFRCLDKACYNALQALRRVAKRSPGMDVADTLVEDPDRFRSMALVLRTDKGTRRERQNLDDVKEYLQSMAATRTQSRSRRQMLLTKRQWVCWQKQTNGYGGDKALQLWKAAKLNQAVHKEKNASGEIVIAADLPLELQDTQAVERRRQIEQRMALGDAKEEAKLRSGLQKKAPRQPKADFLRKRSKVNLADLSSETDEEESGSSKSEIPRTASPRARKGSRASASTQPKRRREKRGDALDSDSDAPPRKARSQAGSEPYKPCQRKGDKKVSFQCFPAAEDTDEDDDADAAECVSGKAAAVEAKQPALPITCEAYTGKLIPAAFISWKKRYSKAMLARLGRYARNDAKSSPTQAGRAFFDKVSDDCDVKVLDFELHERDLLATISKIREHSEDANWWKQSQDVGDLQKRGETLFASFNAQRDRYEEVVSAIREVEDMRREENAKDKRKSRNQLSRKAKLFTNAGVPFVLARLWAQGPTEGSGDWDQRSIEPCKFDASAKGFATVDALVSFLDKNKEKVSKKASSLKAKMTSSAGVIMLDFGGQETPDVTADGLDLVESAGELLLRPILVGIAHFSWKWHANAWPLAGLSAFVIGHTGALLITVITVSELREEGLDAMSGVGNFVKTLEAGQALGGGSHKTFQVGPGEALWIPHRLHPAGHGRSRGGRWG